MSQPTHYMVCFDDQMGLCAPMTLDPECEGAIQASCHGDTIALFGSRGAARKAITISRQFATLKKSQGLPHNEDFLPPCSKNVQIKKAQLVS